MVEENRCGGKKGKFRQDWNLVREIQIEEGICQIRLMLLIGESWR